MEGLPRKASNVIQIKHKNFKNSKRHLNFYQPDANYSFEIILQGSLDVPLEIEGAVCGQMSLQMNKLS